MIPNFVKDLVYESLHEVAIEEIIDDTCFKLIKELANPMAGHIY